MIKLNKVVIVVILLLSISIKAQVTFLKHRNQIEISDWKFKKGVIYNAHQNEFDSSSWESVSVPHTYSMDAINEVAYDKVKAWYRSEFTTKKTTDERTFIRFEAVGQEAKIYVNGKYIGQHIGGYSAFCFDITDAITSGRNLLAVQVSNAPNFKRIPVTDGLFNLYGGIYRNVTLFKTPINHIKPDFHASSGVFVTLKSIDKSAEIAVKTLLNLDKNNKQPITIHYVIKDAKRNVILNKSHKIHQKNEIKETLIIPKPHLWQGKQDPYIYTLEVSLISDKSTDKIVQTFGLRNYKVDPNTGFHLNGKPYRSYGVSMHQEWKQVGPALTKENHEKDFELIDEIGATALRMSHYQHSDYSYELADKIGLLVWSEIPFVHDYSGREQQNAKQQLTELIFQNYNHPSIVYWGLWNEVRAYRSPDEPCVLLTKELNKLAHQLDSTRITVSASDRPDISNMGNITDMQAWNKYYGWYYGAYEDMATWLDTAHKNYPDRHLGISEYGVGGNPMQQNASRVEKPIGNYFPEQEQSKYHEISWKIIQDRPFIFGSYIWNMFDFSVAGWNRGGIPNLNHKGLVSYDRKIKKDAFYFYKANWSKDLVLYIAERRNIDRKSEEIKVKVYTNTPKVTLFVNDKKVAMQKNTSDIKVVVFDNVTLQKGDNTIRVVSGKLTDEIVWNLKY